MNAAERQAQAQQDVERVASALIDAMDCYVLAPSPLRVQKAVRELLHRDVIRLGARPIVEPPMEGQRTIEDEERLSHMQAALT